MVSMLLLFMHLTKDGGRATEVTFITGNKW